MLKKKSFFLLAGVLATCFLSAHEPLPPAPVTLEAKNAFMRDVETEMEFYQKNHSFSLSAAVQELMIGIPASYFNKNLVEQIAEEEKKKENGEYIEYWSNGQIKFKGSFKNHLAEGHVHGWYADGKDAFKGFFKEGVKIGIHITFLPNEIDSGSNAYLRVLTFNENGKLDGEQKLSHPNGAFKSVISYRNGIAEGHASFYYRALGNSKARHFEVNYKNGKPSF